MKVAELIEGEIVERDMTEQEETEALEFLSSFESTTITNDTELMRAINSVADDNTINAILEYIVGGNE